MGYFEPEWGIRDITQENHWIKIDDIGKFKINKPTIFCFGGNGTIGSKDANATCEIVESLMGIGRVDSTELRKSVDFIGVGYSESKNLSLFAIDEMVENFFIPMFVDENGNRKNIDSICKQLSLMTFFTYCHGATEVNRIMGILNSKLETLGFNKNEIDTLYSSMMQISYSPEDYGTYIPEVHLFSKMDEMEDDIFDIQRFNFSGDIGITLEKAYTIDDAKSDKIGIYSKRLINNSPIDYNEHSINIILRDDKWRSNKYGKNADCASLLLAYALCESVANSVVNSRSDKFIPKLPLEELMARLQDVKGSFKDEDLAYEK